MTITLISIGIILGFFVAFLLIIKRAKNNNTFKQKQNVIDYFPSFLSTLGVLGTFFGITLGLYDFNTSSISTSIETLLNGLKMAFGTSIAGMICSMYVSWRINCISDKLDKDTPSTEQDAILKLYSAIEKMSIGQGKVNDSIDNLTNQNKILQTQIVNLLESQAKDISALSKSMNTVPTTQEKMLSIMDNQAKRIVSINEIASKIEKSNSIIIDTHEELIGVNKHLNSSNISLERIESNIEKSQSTTSSVLTQLGEMVDILSTQSGIQEETLYETKSLSATVKGEIVVITDAMEKGNKLMANKFDEFSDLMRKNNVEALVEVMKKVTEEFNKQMNDLISKLVQENFDQLNKSVENLNTWQKENKVMVSELTSQYKDMTIEFKSTSTILHEVADNTHALVGDNSQLQRLINELQKVLIDDTKFIEMTGKLNDAVGKINNGTEAFDEATHELNTWIRNHRDLGDGVRLLVNKLDEINQIKDINNQFWQETKKHLNEGVGLIANASAHLNDSVSTINEEFYNRLNGTLSNLDACIQAMYENGRKY
ncbi:MAG: hypothetical protein EOM50_15105 [Erysipelotrichia bacterium]|nr:hypothetical protein [Erysipelotrichia bacterium]